MPSTSVSPKAGGTAKGKVPDCDTLRDSNLREREKFIKKMEANKRKNGALNKGETTAYNKARRGGMTYSSARSTIPGARAVMTQSSSGLANAYISKSMRGGTGAQMVGLNKKIRQSKAARHNAKKRKAGVLCNGSHVHPGGGKGAHGECKIFNNLSNIVGSTMRGGSVLLNIDWRRNVGKAGVDYSGMPCEDCYAMLCHAARECKIKILICDKDNKPTELSEDNCDDPDGYSDLSERVDGGISPGGRPPPV